MQNVIIQVHILYDDIPAIVFSMERRILLILRGRRILLCNLIENMPSSKFNYLPKLLLNPGSRSSTSIVLYCSV